MHSEGYLLAFERDRIGERYILGGENLSLWEFLASIARRTGRRAPRINLPRGLLYPLAGGAEMAARLTGKKPLLKVDGLRMSRYRMFFTFVKAEREPGCYSCPCEDGIADALIWFRQAAYLA